MVVAVVVILVSASMAISAPVASAATRPAAPEFVGAPVAGNGSALVRWETPHRDADQKRTYTVSAYRGSNVMNVATLRVTGLANASASATP